MSNSDFAQPGTVECSSKRALSPKPATRQNGQRRLPGIANSR